MKLVTAAQLLSSNPFGGDRNRWRLASATLLEHTKGRIGPKLAKSLAPRELKRVVLALGHLQACEHPDEPRDVLGPEVLPRSVRDRLPRPRSAYLRIVMAAGRCHAALAALTGRSQLLEHVRAQSWTACFGDSLVHALGLERVIRDHDVLLLGETGTGKELIAHAIQRATPGPDDGSPAAHAAVNAAALPEALIESELFGHVRGAFTGATDTRAGRIRSADGGCFFLDEVGDLDPHTQVKLLRVIETNQVSPLGADTAHPVDVRYVGATHRDIFNLVDEGTFRRDLHQRLAGITIRIPPLRDRPEDIVDIGRAFVTRYVPERLRKGDSIDRWLKQAAHMTYDWPGNVRELQNAIRNLLLGLDAGIDENAPPTTVSSTVGIPLQIARHVATLSEVEDWYIHAVLAAEDGNFAAAARKLGLDRSTVRRRARIIPE
jgi:transcriptional regulator of acetoin/glycerol metabolism